MPSIFVHLISIDLRHLHCQANPMLKMDRFACMYWRMHSLVWCEDFTNTLYKFWQ
ncbi:unnamed protein product [Musa acuminata subsp. malaccensis]|uniref:(wild Malaysian banana) hypothetical protein n=1 Tax=Musa acuminata subsp. malaccensis TaxID=214687 RepID=A0A804JJM2_MUSAM|nr:unnamed protein product [Musa acuminata subsp. malaccensis]